MSDLKLIDELLLDVMQSNKLTPRELFHRSSVAQEGMLRIRRAWINGEMPEISATWGRHFEDDLVWPKS